MVGQPMTHKGSKAFIGPKFLDLIEPFVCFLNFVFVSNFSIFASRRSELTL
jgi:hypothetical protein